ncbi:tetratricopeptide repeat protein [Frondihabitans cladoniiphilus]|uniref:Tetratricopeptide repeat protein n=1 Tax=Frondihabitans cladoniiphilus TaxID=715785 RepID=A0ABP8VQT7_9MICO
MSDTESHAERDQAVALIDADRPLDAIRVLSRVLAREPDDVVALDLMGLAQRGAGRPRDALAAATRLLSLIPGHPSALRTAARSHSALGEHDLAHEAAVAGVRSAPDDPDGLITLADVVLGAGSATPEALWAAEKAVRIAPWASATHVTLGNVQRRSKEPAKARASYLQALTIDPHSEAARNNLALVDLDANRTQSAVRIFGQLLRENPRYTVAHRNLVIAVTVAFRNIRLFLIGPYIAMVLVGFGLFGSTPTQQYTGRWTVALLSVAAVLLYTGRFLRAGGPGLRRFLGATFRSSALFAVSTVLLFVAPALFVFQAASTPVSSAGPSPSTGQSLPVIALIIGNLVLRSWSKRTLATLP